MQKFDDKYSKPVILVDPRKMRPLTEEETEKVLGKLTYFIGDNVAQLIDRSDGNYCFRNHKVQIF